MSLLKTAHRSAPFEPGQTMTEYSLILAAIAVVLISLYSSAGTIVAELVTRVGPLL